MRTLNATILAQLQAKELRPFLILDMDLDGTHVRYTDCDVPIGVRYKYEAITGGPTVHGLSLADGAAFVRLNGLDLSPFAGVAGVRTPCKLTLTDSAGKKAAGWIGAADEAEALSGIELILNSGFETAGGGGADIWANWSEAGISDGAMADEATIVHAGSHAAKLTCGATITTDRCRLSPNGTVTDVPVTAGKLYKFTVWTRGDGTNSGAWAVYDVINAKYIPDTMAARDVTYSMSGTVYTQYSGYFTAPSGCTKVRMAMYAPPVNGGICYLDDASVQSVTHVGTDGVHIVSAQNGSTRNWASIEAGFNYNDAAYTVEIGNVRFNPKGMKFEPIRYSMGRVVDSMKVQIDNLDDALTSYFVGGTPQGGTVTLQAVLLDANYEMVAAPLTLFEGTLDGWDLDEEKVSLTVASELVRWNQKTLAKHSPSCRWKEFKGTECAYAGAETWCDRTYTRCAALGNQANFGGFRWLPSIQEKEIWWGKNRAI